ncbi:unnamed protein product [Rhizophagus irregularis]|nr:unnamed protein product [Rhizophagus irregularis]
MYHIFSRFPCRNILSSFRLSDDFGGSSALQQGDFGVSFGLEKEISVFNFFSTWDFGRLIIITCTVCTVS